MVFQIFHTSLPGTAGAVGTLNGQGFLAVNMNQFITVQCPGNGKRHIKSIGRKGQDILFLSVICQAVGHKNHRGAAMGQAGFLHRPVCAYGTAGNKGPACSGKVLPHGPGKETIFREQVPGTDHSHRWLGQQSQITPIKQNRWSGKSQGSANGIGITGRDPGNGMNVQILCPVQIVQQLLIPIQQAKNRISLFLIVTQCGQIGGT